ncbi:Biopolymer transport exbB protein [Bartonella clarridgeiae 73]|uniref:Biopolymer transport exbB protein n=1 Tax=Bartonella clarridgeiae (strain CCUG 45776 / CIP 104772 / 73) TaxID=696125 RepID=E6YJ46_BARC7|nr:MotA/TolQ/ExbB proton channel family protein [Bartonella clarridgeiae]WCR55878.1 MAG: MotA/TolQ/ExbB proton channel family protein [Bartonella clarridgeiae]CBI76884.1 Biopolymer transport exbB protein [Bartonella clarridgeiae 73]
MTSHTVPLENDTVTVSMHDFSPFSMFMAADWVVKAVIIFLLLTSLLSWTIAFVKIVELTVAKYKARHALQLTKSAQTLAGLAASFKEIKGTAVFLLEETLKEIRLSSQLVKSDDSNNNQCEAFSYDIFSCGSISINGVKERVHSLLSRCLLAAMRRIACGTAILATIGSVAPFVGLFATVWGIMNSFIGIAKSQTTRLDVVAPGIAEALLATAIGLFVAIPAVIIYNSFIRVLNGYRNDLADIAAAIERLVSREFDRQQQDKNYQISHENRSL